VPESNIHDRSTTSRRCRGIRRTGQLEESAPEHL
jgi:hypothetical protein